MQGWSTVSIRIENSVLAKIVEKYEVLGFEKNGAWISFLDDDGEECVQYESVPGKIEDIPGCIAEAFQVMCDDDGARAFEKECTAHKKEILNAYETVYWDYSTTYSLEESVEDHVGESYIEKFREDYATENGITTEEVNDDDFQTYLDEAMRIRCDETFHYKKRNTRNEGNYDCEYTIID